MRNFDDRAKLAANEEARFIESCQAEFVERSLAATNARKVRTLTGISFLPNVISAVTAGFFVVFLLTGYPRPIAMLLGALLLAVVTAVEVGKRGLITGIAKEYFVAAKVAGLGIFALCILIAVSMVASYQGGKQLITETATEPVKEINPEIATLQAQLADQKETINRLQRTTWKGKITVDATKGINAAKKIEGSLIERITALQAADDAAHSELVAKQSGQRLNFGYLLGVLAALADAFLLGLLWTSQRLKYEVASVTYQGGKSGSAAGSHYLTGRSGVGANPASLNQVEKERRPIGFHRKVETEHREDETPLTETETDDNQDGHDEANETPYNGTAFNETPSTEPETVTVTEYVKLTDRVKDCEHCRKPFVYRTSRAKYCSDECRIAAWEERTGKTWRKSNS
jgi:hypothetical protein